MRNERRDGEHGLDPGDAELVRRIAETYRPPARDASARAVFRARVDARLRSRALGRRWAAAAAVACAIGIVWLRGPLATDPSAPDTAADDALLALALPAASEEEALPADYQAIEDLLLDNEGV